jgi:hypothetical protein
MGPDKSRWRKNPARKSRNRTLLLTMAAAGVGSVIRASVRLVASVFAGSGSPAALNGFPTLNCLGGVLRRRYVFMAPMAAFALLFHFIAAGMGKASTAARNGFPALECLGRPLLRRYVFMAPMTAFELLFHCIAAGIWAFTALKGFATLYCLGGFLQCRWEIMVNGVFAAPVYTLDSARRLVLRCCGTIMMHGIICPLTRRVIDRDTGIPMLFNARSSSRRLHLIQPTRRESPGILSGGCTGTPTVSVLLMQSGVSVFNAFPVDRVMPPFTVVMSRNVYIVLPGVITIIPVDRDVLRRIYVYVTAGPIGASPGIPPGSSQAHGDTERNKAGADNSITRRMIIVRGICRVPPGAIYDHWIVNRNIYDMRVRGFDHDRLFLNHHHLLGRCFEGALRLGFGSQVLNRGHYLVFLTEKGVSKILGPFQVFVHHGQDRGKVHQRLHAGIPVFFLQGSGQTVVFQVRVLVNPPGGLNHFQGIGGGHEHLDQQRIRIQSDRRQHLIQLFLPEHRRRRLGILTKPSGRNHER